MLPRQLILAFDTSAAHCAVALFADGKCLEERAEPMNKGQAERLFPMCEEVLENASIKWQNLDALAVCVGPGNFTGVRVAVSAARGLALSLKKPAIGISKLEAMGLGSKGKSTVVMDARRHRVYMQNFQDGNATDTPALVELDNVNTSITAIMTADDTNWELFPNRYTPQITLSCAVATLAINKMGNHNPRPAPLYLQEPNADLPREQPVVIL